MKKREVGEIFKKLNLRVRFTGHHYGWLVVNSKKILRVHKNCTERIFEYERKSGMNFGEFETAWQEGKIAGRHSHGVEHDYMEWESLEDEHRELLHKLKKMREDQKRS